MLTLINGIYLHYDALSFCVVKPLSYRRSALSILFQYMYPFFITACNIDAYYGRESANACCMMIRAFAEACRDKGLAPEAGWTGSFPQCREEFAQMQQQRG